MFSFQLDEEKDRPVRRIFWARGAAMMFHRWGKEQFELFSYFYQHDTIYHITKIVSWTFSRGATAPLAPPPPLRTALEKEYISRRLQVLQLHLVANCKFRPDRPSAFYNMRGPDLHVFHLASRYGWRMKLRLNHTGDQDLWWPGSVSHWRVKSSGVSQSKMLKATLATRGLVEIVC